MSTKMVRIHIGTKCECVSGCKKLFYQVNTISRIDDINRQNENEIPLFEVEQKIECPFCPSCRPTGVKFEFFDANTKQLFSVSEIREVGSAIKVCCGDNYFIYPDIYTFKCSNSNDQSVIKRYDTREFYRTYEYLQQPYYKIGKPYVPKEETCSCTDCCCCPTSLPSCSCDCCCCSNTVVEIDKRSYIDIFNMTDQSVGKFVEYNDIT